MTDAELSDLAKEWLNPVAVVLADLIAKSYIMPVGAFMFEVENTITKTPMLFNVLNMRAYEDALTQSMEDAALKSIERAI
jgi:hypothetical protein